MPDHFTGEVKLSPSTSNVRARIFFGHACAGAFSAWMFDEQENETFVRYGDNKAGASVEFDVGPNAQPIQGPSVKNHVFSLNGAVQSPLKQAGSYSVRIDITQGDAAAERSPVVFQGNLNDAGVARFWAYVTLKA